MIPVARLRGDPACGWIDLARGAKIYLLQESGRVTAVLTATDYPRGGMRWIEMDDNYSLQNILIALFGWSWRGLTADTNFSFARLRRTQGVLVELSAPSLL